MRIRRNASKILGSAACVYAHAWPSPAKTVSSAAPEADEVICELNCSPWDVMEMDLDPYCYSFGSILKEEEEIEEGWGILGNTVKIEEEEEEEEEPISVITSNSTAAELTLKEMKDQKVGEKKKKQQMENRKKMNSKGKERLDQVLTNSNTAAALVVQYCKKSDGKGWHCKRPAQLPHTLCGYHLAQLRSYSSRHHSHNSKAPDNASSASAAAAAGAADDSNLYYYYGGFGPWRAKRRVRPCNASKLKEEDHTDIKESSGDHDEDSIVAGDDEYDLDCFDDGDDDDNYSMWKDDEEANYGNKEGQQEEVEEEKKKLPKKRGRKPIKARSLKSLL